ncbi:MAG: TadE family protein [Planctomycetota bacterium]|jgi:Flp pilus assembly protein TadG
MVGGRKQNRYRGLATVEAAIVFPLLLILTLGAIEYGWMFLKAQQITNAARQAARIAIRPDSSNTDVLNQIDTLMTSAEMEGSGYAVTFTPADISTLAVGDHLEIQVSVPWANIGLMNIPLLPAPASIGASVAMAKEGP